MVELFMMPRPPSSTTSGHFCAPPTALIHNFRSFLRTAKLEGLMEKAIRSGNWGAALYAVERNDGAPGPGGMRADELRAHLAIHGEVIAVEAAQSFAREGFTHVVDMDITKFFDKVNHDILMSKIGTVIGDKAVMKLIGKYLRAGVVMPDGLKVSSEEGTPQGGPLSPLLANIYLDALDKELEKRGLRFARYADDCNIYVKSQAAAERVLAGLTGWIKRHLRLEVSESKSGVGRPRERKFLGFIITSALLIGIAPASLTRFEDRVRELWNARQPLTSEQLRDQWRSYVNGWWGYYRRCEWRRDIYRKEPWIRRHIRKCFWQRWHKSKGRESALRRLGLPPSRAIVGRSSRGAWRMAGNPVMHEALNNRTLRRYGFLMPSDLKS